jgi:hypothetical protein
MTTKNKTRDREPALFEQAEAAKPQVPPKEPRKKADAAPKIPGTNVAKFEPRPTNLMVVFANAAADPKCDTQKMRELKDLMAELKREEAEVAFTEAYIEMRAEMPTINKDGMIDHGESRSGRASQKTRYSSYENIMDVAQPILTRHKFMMTCLAEPKPDGVGVRIHGTLTRVHETQYGKTVHKIETLIDVPPEVSGSKNPAQGVGSSLSYSKRYAVISLVGIISRAPQDRDRDGNAPPKQKEPPTTINGSQEKELLKAINDCGVDPATFLQKYEIDAVRELPANLFAEAMKACANYKAAKEKKA